MRIVAVSLAWHEPTSALTYRLCFGKELTGSVVPRPSAGRESTMDGSLDDFKHACTPRA